MGSGSSKKLRKFVAADERVVNCERALREALARHDRQLLEEQISRLVYLVVWMKRSGGAPLHVSQSELRDAKAEMERGARVTFTVLSDGETLEISLVSDSND